MAIYSTFFLCRPSELLNGFPGWKEPLAVPVKRKSRNPFTGEEMTIESTAPDWPDADSEDEQIPEMTVVAVEGDYATYLENRLPPFVQSQPHRCMKNLTSVELEPLQEAAGIETPELKTALYAPPSFSAGLEVFDDALIESLRITESLQAVAKHWAKTMSTPDFTHSVTGERIQDDMTIEEAMDVLQPIGELARKQTDGQRLYLLNEW